MNLGKKLKNDQFLFGANFLLFFIIMLQSIYSVYSNYIQFSAIIIIVFFSLKRLSKCAIDNLKGIFITPAFPAIRRHSSASRSR